MERRHKRLWLCINIILFTWKVHQYRRRKAFQVLGYCLCIAKGAGETLKFNMALILLPVCRRTLTRLRETFLGSVVPFDDNINFHKLIALAIAIGTFVHTVLHVSCNLVRISTCSPERFGGALGGYFNYRQPSYLDLVESVPGLTGIGMIILMTFAFTLAMHSFRRNVIKLPWPFHHLAGFNAFWYAHHLLVFVYILLVLHGYFIFLTHEWYKKTVRSVTLYYLRMISFDKSLYSIIYQLSLNSHHNPDASSNYQTSMYFRVAGENEDASQTIANTSSNQHL